MAIDELTPVDVLKRRTITRATKLAVRAEDPNLALAALRLQDAAAPDGEARALFDVYARAAKLGEQNAQQHRDYEGTLGRAYCESVRPELEQASSLGQLAMRVLRRLGR